MPKTAKDEFHHLCDSYLKKNWDYVFASKESLTYVRPAVVSEETEQRIRKILTSESKSYHYILITQILAKAVNPELDCRSIQKTTGRPGAFDARSLCTKVIVPWERQNHNLLGGSSDPYVSNPMRIQGVYPEYSSDKRVKEWADIEYVLNEIQKKNNTTYTESVYSVVLSETHSLLVDANIVYPVPHRISRESIEDLLIGFIKDPSGGDREETIVTALLRTIGNEFHYYSEIKRGKVNAADSASGMAADIECMQNAQIKLLIEVKDHLLSKEEVLSTIDKARSKKITETLFICKGIKESDKASIHNIIQSQFTAGQNIYVDDILHFARGIFVLLGERGRVAFLSEVGPELDRSRSLLKHRKAWAAMLKAF